MKKMMQSKFKSYQKAKNTNTIFKGFHVDYYSPNCKIMLQIIV